MKKRTPLSRTASFLCSLLVLTATLFPSVAAQLDLLQGVRSTWISSLGSVWKENNHCEWEGVTCGADGMVTQLDLSNRNLTGSIPSQIWRLTSLETLSLSGNENLRGSLPSDVANLVKLRNLNLQYCGFTGPIPAGITQLSSLQFLYLNNNSFTGNIPGDLAGLKSLFYFDISSNQLSGQIPLSIGSIPNLGHIHFQHNQLTGQIPSTVANLSELLHFVVEDNNLSGPLPELKSTSITVISASDNPFGSTIPRSYFSLPSLGQLSLASCNLTDNLVDVKWERVPKLVNLDLSGNPSLIGALPTGASNLLYLRLDNSRNSINGKKWSTVEEALGAELSNLQELHLASCGLMGDISTTPVGNLIFLDVSNNGLSGVVPIGLLTKPGITLKIEGNVDLCNGKTDPTIVRACSKDGLIMNFTTPDAGVPCGGACSVGQRNPVYEVLNPGSPVCPCASPLTIHLRFIRAGFSQRRLADGGLARNLSEQLAQNFGLRWEQVQIDKNVTAEGMDILATTFWWPADDSRSLSSKVSHNISRVLGNHQPVLQPPFGIFYVESVTHPPELFPQKRESMPKGAITGIVVAVVVFVLGSMGLAVYAFCFMKRRILEVEASKNMILGTSYGGAAHTGTSAGPRLKGARLFTMGELRKATKDFASENVIGTGGYGKVYKGCLEDSREVAAKRLDKQSQQGPQEFNSEIELLSRVHHRNLVELVGFCNVEGEQVLVYDFMHNGTVKDWLTGIRMPPLSFSKRLEIALGAAQGLNYLHHDCSPAIIHRDIKSANILLSSSFTAKVADFGLSKNVDPGDDEVSFVKGTLGYLDPDYYNTQLLSEKTDVYSFGVVLLELMTGNPPVNKTTRVHICRDVKAALAEGAILKLKDPAFKHDDFKEDIYKDVVNLGLRCLQDGDERAFRPSMAVVVKELDAICQAAGVIKELPTSPTSLRQRSAASMDFTYPSGGDGTTTTFTSGTTDSSFFKSVTKSFSTTKKHHPKSPKSMDPDIEKQEKAPISIPDPDDSQIGMTRIIASWWRPGGSFRR